MSIIPKESCIGIYKQSCIGKYFIILLYFSLRKQKFVKRFHTKISVVQLVHLQTNTFSNIYLLWHFLIIQAFPRFFPPFLKLATHFREGPNILSFTISFAIASYLVAVFVVAKMQSKLTLK